MKTFILFLLLSLFPFFSKSVGCDFYQTKISDLFQKFDFSEDVKFKVLDEKCLRGSLQGAHFMLNFAILVQEKVSDLLQKEDLSQEAKKAMIVFESCNLAEAILKELTINKVDCWK